MGAGGDAPDPDCESCYANGVICALFGASLQAMGLQLWKLHFLKKDEETKAEDAHENNDYQQNYAPTQMSDTKDEAGLRTRLQRGSTTGQDPGDITINVPLEMDSPQLCVDTGQMAIPSQDRTLPRTPSSEIQKSVSFQQIIRHVRNNSGHSHSSTYSASYPNERENFERSAHRPPATPAAGGQQERKSMRQCLGASWIWWSGSAIFLVGNILDFIALGLTKVSIVTLVGSGSLIVNTVSARLLLKETVTQLDILSSVFIIAGIALTVIGNQSHVAEWPLEDLIAQYKRPDVVIMLVVLAAIIGAGVFLVVSDSARRKIAGIPKPNKFIGAVTCLTGAFIATYTILFGKAFSGLMLLTMSGNNQFKDVFTVVIVMVFLVSLPSQLVLINMSLAINDALMHIPNFYVFWNLGAIISGAIFYQELRTLTVADLSIFFTGVVVLIVAVTLTNISGARKHKAAEEAAAATASSSVAAHSGPADSDMSLQPDADVRAGSDGMNEATMRTPYLHSLSNGRPTNSGDVGGHVPLGGVQQRPFMEERANGGASFPEDTRGFREDGLLGRGQQRPDTEEQAFKSAGYHEDIHEDVEYSPSHMRVATSASPVVLKARPVLQCAFRAEGMNLDILQKTDYAPTYMMPALVPASDGLSQNGEPESLRSSFEGRRRILI
jgi:drug/metabolite transporter (DMT)-like permease